MRFDLGASVESLLVLACAALACSVGGCKSEKPAPEPTRAADAPTYGGVYRTPLKHDPVTLDPATVTATYGASVVQQIFDGLVAFDENLNVVPCVAESWQASQDGRVWTFHLRRGVRFHNGREVQAEDVVYSFTRVLDPGTSPREPRILGSVLGAKEFRDGAVDHVEGLEALDPYRVRITLSRPYAPFISTLGMTTAKIVPREEVERPGVDFGKRPVGTGPFRFGSWEAARAIRLPANETYFAGRPFVDELVYRVFPGAPHAVMLAAFGAGELEDTGSLPGKAERRAADDAGYRHAEKPLLATLFLLMNVREPPLDRVEVRQAINHAIDRDAINAAIRHRFTKAKGFLPLGMPGYNPEVPGYEYDVQRARQLLARAGFQDGQGLPTLTLWTSVTTGMVMTEHEMVKRDLAKVGIDVELRHVDSWEQFQGVLGKRPMALYRFAWYADFPDPDTFLSSLFHSEGSHNYTNYSNPEVDRLVERAQREVDYLERIALYRQAERLVVADAPAVSLIHPVYQEMIQPYVRGLELNALGERYIPLTRVWLDRGHPGFPGNGAAR